MEPSLGTGKHEQTFLLSLKNFSGWTHLLSLKNIGGRAHFLSLKSLVGGLISWVSKHLVIGTRAVESSCIHDSGKGKEENCTPGGNQNVAVNLRQTFLL